MAVRKAWMAGTSPGMTNVATRQSFFSGVLLFKTLVLENVEAGIDQLTLQEE